MIDSKYLLSVIYIRQIFSLCLCFDLVLILCYSCVVCLVVQLCPTLLWPHRLYPSRLLCPWNFSGKNTAVGCHFLLQGIFLTQGSNPGLLHCRQMLYHLSHQGSPGNLFQFSSVQFSHSVVSDSLWPRESQHTRPPCLSPSPRVNLTNKT